MIVTEIKKTHPLSTKLGNLDSDRIGFNIPAFSVKKDFSHSFQRTRYLWSHLEM